MNNKTKVQSPKARKLSNGQDEGQPSPPKTPTKHGKRSRRSLKRKHPARKSSTTAAVDDEEDAEFIAVATMASAPNSPAGLRSLLAEHLLSARTLADVSTLDFDSPSEDTLIAESQSDSHEGERMVESVAKPFDGSGKWNSEECPEENETVLSLHQEVKKERKQCHLGELPSQHDQTDSVTFPKVRSLLTTEDGAYSLSKSSENQNERCGDNDFYTDQTLQNIVCDSMNTGGKKSSQLLGACVPDSDSRTVNNNSSNCLSSSSYSNNDRDTHEAGNESGVAGIQDSAESDVVLNHTETNPKGVKVANDSEKSGDQSPVLMNSCSVESEEMETDQVDPAEVRGKARQSPTACKRQVSVPNESGSVNVSFNGSSPSNTAITYSISEAVKLKKQATTPTKDHDRVPASKGRRVRAKKRTAREAGLDDSLSDVAQDHVASPQSQSESSLGVLPQSSSSTPTTTKRGNSKAKTKTPAQKPVLPKAGTDIITCTPEFDSHAENLLITVFCY